MQAGGHPARARRHRDHRRAVLPEPFRATYGDKDGASLPIRVRRGDQELTLTGTVRLVVLTQQRLVLDPDASAKAPAHPARHLHRKHPGN
ncbi:MAG: hypothetical protein IPG75_20595 [Gemmatimonadetes bacterium]|nr:hypothetical protein [Gemmatimonadota bacterium]